METYDGLPKKRKTMKRAANEAIDTALYLWFVQKRSEGPNNGRVQCKGSKKAAVGWTISKTGTTFES